MVIFNWDICDAIYEHEQYVTNVIGQKKRGEREKERKKKEEGKEQGKKKGERRDKKGKVAGNGRKEGT